MEIYDFLPTYPDANALSPDLFNEMIFRKKEFYELKLDRNTVSRGNYPNKLLDHQEIIARFLSNHTIYDELLMVAAMGTGKTISSLGVCERIISDPETSIRKVLILVKNGLLARQFQNELVAITEEKYLPPPEDLTDMEPRRALLLQRNRIRARVREYYTITTHEAFSNLIEKTSVENIKNLYSNHIIIVDEAHNLVGTEMYPSYFRFLHNLVNRKIILMTGTPMRNDIPEFASLMNLILPLSKQFPVGSDFYKKYTVGEGENLRFTQFAETEIHEMIIGRVSYLLSSGSMAKKQYIGVPIAPVKYFNLVGSRMSRFQSAVYQTVFDNEEEGLKDNSQQASLFVFPDGSIGSAGFHKYIQKSTHNATNEFRKLKGRDEKETISNIAQCSAKYGSILREIMNEVGSKQPLKCFIYCESIQQGGAIVLGECLRLLGFSRIYGKLERGAPKRLRFSILSEQVQKVNVEEVIQSFNSPENANGELLQVLIGGKMMREGINLKNITQIHVATPQWNFSTIDQAIARGVRAFSHSDPNAVVDIFLHTALPSDSMGIDLYMYHTSELKDIAIKRLERIIQQGAFDCALNYERNKNEMGRDGSRECYYSSCLYTCSGMDFPYVRTDLDYSSYNVWFSFTERQEIQKQLISFFQRRRSVFLEQILSELKSHHPYLILDTLDQLITNQTVINRVENEFGDVEEYYLTHDHNVYFLSRFAQLTQPASNGGYTEIRTVEQELPTVVSDIVSDQVIEAVAQFDDLPLSERLRRLDEFPRHIQEMFIEASVLADEMADETKPLVRAVLEKYRDSIKRNSEGVYSFYSLPNVRFLPRGETEWRDIEYSDVSGAFIDSFIKNNPFGYYASLQNGVMRIITLSGEEDEKKRGKVCSSFEVKDLVSFVEMFGASPAGTKKKEICRQLEGLFDGAGLLYRL